MRALLVCALFLCFTLCVRGQCSQLTPVKLQLKWLLQAQFAPYLAARDFGFYEEECLDVLVNPGGNLNERVEVQEGRAQFGISSGGPLLADRVNLNFTLVNVGQTFQRSGKVQVAFKARHTVQHPLDFVGKTIGAWDYGNDFEIQVALKMFGLSACGFNTDTPNCPSPLPDDMVAIKRQDFNMAALLSGDIDAASAEAYNEYAQILETPKVEEGDELWQEDDLDVIAYDDVGIKMLQDGIFTNEKWLEDPVNQDITVRFLAASVRGMIFCREHPQRCVSLLPSVDAHQQWQMNTINTLIWPAPLGAGLVPEDVKKSTADLSYTYGLLERPVTVSDAFQHQYMVAALERVSENASPKLLENGIAEADVFGLDFKSSFNGFCLTPNGNRLIVCDSPDCRPGTYYLKKLCTPCPLGQYSAEVGPLNCTECAPGTFQGLTGQTACRLCPKGSIQEQSGLSKCQNCNPRTYSDEEGGVVCSTCPTGSSNFLDRLLIEQGVDLSNLTFDDRQQCVCEPGMWGLSGESCTPCPVGASCCACPASELAASLARLQQGLEMCDECLAGLSLPLPKPGYVLSTENSVHGEGRPVESSGVFVVECHIAEACAGGEDSPCQRGYTGRRCGGCESGYFRLGNSCLECQAGNVFLAVLFLFLVIILVLFFLWVSVHQLRLCTAIILMDFFQVLALFGLFNLNFSSGFAGFLEISSLLNFNVQLFSIDCLWGSPDGGGDYYNRWLAMLFVPLFAIVVYAIVYGLVELARRQAGYPEPKVDSEAVGFKAIWFADLYRKEIFVGAYMLFLGSIYTLMSITSLELFFCKQHTDGSYYLQAAPWENCYSDRWNAFMPVAVVASVFWVIVPLVLAYYLRKLAKAGKLMDESVMRMFGVYYLSYSEARYWWDAVDMIRNFLVVLAVVLFSQPIFRALFAMLTLLIYILVEAHFQPFRFALLNELDLVVDNTFLFVLFCGVMSETKQLVSVYHHGDLAVLALLIVWIVVVLVALMVALYVETKDAHRHYSLRKKAGTHSWNYKFPEPKQLKQLLSIDLETLNAKLGDFSTPASPLSPKKGGNKDPFAGVVVESPPQAQTAQSGLANEANSPHIVSAKSGQPGRPSEASTSAQSGQPSQAIDQVGPARPEQLGRPDHEKTLQEVTAELEELVERIAEAERDGDADINVMKDALDALRNKVTELQASG